MIVSKMMKQIVATSTCVVLSTSVAYAQDMGQATENRVNVRTDMSLESEVIAKINNGMEFNVYDIYDGWFEIEYEGESAYVSADYFALTSTEAEISGDKVNVRSDASKSGDVLDRLYDGDVVTVKGKTGEWYLVTYDDVEGYVNEDYIAGDNLDNVLTSAGRSSSSSNVEVDDDAYGVVISDNGLRLRKEASRVSNILEVLPYGADVSIDRVGDEWIRVITNDGQKGYVSAEFLDIRSGEREVRSVAANTSKGEEVVAFAKQFIGTPYSWGGTNLKTGVDCSGFVYAVMKNYGISLNRSSRDMVHNGVSVAKSDLVAGDLVFFNSGGDSSISHVGMYIGNGQYIHSTDGAAYGVTITSLSSDYSARTYVAARRVLN